MDLADFADVDPHAGDSRNGRTALVVSQAEHAGIEILQRGHRLVLGVDAHAGVMKFDNLDRHRLFLPTLPLTPQSFASAQRAVFQRLDLQGEIP
jgi:hypothetical protein